MNHESKWKNFERLVAAIHYAVKQGGQVTWNDTINGRQFDVTIKFKYGLYTFLTVIECKDYKSSVPLEKVEAFVTKALDAKANKGIMVSSSGYQEGCFRVAERHNISLYTLKEINNMPKEYIGSQLVAAFNILDIRLVNSSEKKEYYFPEYGGKLQYLMIHTKIKTEKKEALLNEIISQWMQRKKVEVSNDPKEFCINFSKTIMASIPQEDEPFSFDRIRFNCKFIEVHLAKGPILDAYLIQKLNTSYVYKNKTTGESHELPSHDLAFGFDTKLEAGKFYFNPELEFFYYCDSIEQEKAKMFLVESYQHGQLFQAVYLQSIEYSKYYVEVTNYDEIERLNKLLQRMKAKES